MYFHITLVGGGELLILYSCFQSIIHCAYLLADFFNYHLKWQGKLQDRMAGGKEEYNAFFYSLVSTDTQVCGMPILLN